MRISKASEKQNILEHPLHFGYQIQSIQNSKFWERNLDKAYLGSSSLIQTIHYFLSFQWGCTFAAPALSRSGRQGTHHWDQGKLKAGQEDHHVSSDRAKREGRGLYVTLSLLSAPAKKGIAFPQVSPYLRTGHWIFTQCILILVAGISWYCFAHKKEIKCCFGMTCFLVSCSQLWKCFWYRMFAEWPLGGCGTLLKGNL